MFQKFSNYTSSHFSLTQHIELEIMCKPLYFVWYRYDALIEKKLNRSFSHIHITYTWCCLWPSKVFFCRSCSLRSWIEFFYFFFLNFHLSFLLHTKRNNRSEKKIFFAFWCVNFVSVVSTQATRYTLEKARIFFLDERNCSLLFVDKNTDDFSQVDHL